MIVTRTPFRITLGGGGTDLPAYSDAHGGFVFAMGITHYMYVMVNRPRVDDFIRLHYSDSETVTRLDDLRHDLAREALRAHGITERIEITSVADIPAGTGVGSSGAYLVGLLAALHHLHRDFVSLDRIAEEACHIEIDVLQKPVGRQDQYMAAFGGLTVLDIGRDGRVEVCTIPLEESAQADLVARTHVYYTNVRRDSGDLLAPLEAAARGAAAPDHAAVVESLHRIKDLGHRSLDAIKRLDFDGWGELLHEHWEAKRRMSPGVAPRGVDALYAEVRGRFGVLGGKIIGAGGGGFLMLYCPGNGRALQAFMAERGMRRLEYAVSPTGVDVAVSMPGGARAAE